MRVTKENQKSEETKMSYTNTCEINEDSVYIEDSKFETQVFSTSEFESLVTESRSQFEEEFDFNGSEGYLGFNFGYKTQEAIEMRFFFEDLDLENLTQILSAIEGIDGSEFTPKFHKESNLNANCLSFEITNKEVLQRFNGEF